MLLIFEALPRRERMLVYEEQVRQVEARELGVQETPLLARRVLTHGLVAKPELNGRPGTALSFDDDKGRYSVELDDTSSSLVISLKPCNLLPIRGGDTLSQLQLLENNLNLEIEAWKMTEEAQQLKLKEKEEGAVGSDDYLLFSGMSLLYFLMFQKALVDSGTQFTCFTKATY
jgi:hypothetical protein